MSKHTTRHYCRNTHCRAKLAAPVDNEHHASARPGAMPSSTGIAASSAKMRCGASATINASKTAIKPARTNIGVFLMFSTIPE